MMSINIDKSKLTKNDSSSSFNKSPLANSRIIDASQPSLKGDHSIQRFNSNFSIGGVKSKETSKRSRNMLVMEDSGPIIAPYWNKQNNLIEKYKATRA